MAEARSLPVAVVARRVLGASGALYPEMERPGPDAGRSYPVGGLLGLTGLRFASLPRGGGFSGICTADVVHVWFRAVRRASERDPDPPARVIGIATGPRFRIFGDAEANRNWSERRERGLERACGAAGPVLAPAGSPPRFFAGFAFGGLDFRAVHASFAARALQQAVAAARRDELQPHCTPNLSFRDSQLCADAAATLARQDPAMLSLAEIDRCAPTAAELCLRLSFIQSDSTSFYRRILVVGIETGNATADPPPDRIELRSVSLSGEERAV